MEKFKNIFDWWESPKNCTHAGVKVWIWAAATTATMLKGKKMIKAYYNCWYIASIFLIYLTSVLTVSFLFVSSYVFHYSAYNAYSLCGVRDDLQEVDSLEVVLGGSIQALQGAFQVNQMVDEIQDDFRDDVDSGEDPPLAQEIHMEHAG